MRHHKVNRKFGRVRNQRKALILGLVRSLVLHEKIKTTEEKAKEIRPFVEKMLTRSKKPTLATRREFVTSIGETQTKKLIEVIAAKNVDRKGGYTRITKLPPRASDGAKMAIIEFV